MLSGGGIWWIIFEAKPHLSRRVKRRGYPRIGGVEAENAADDGDVRAVAPVGSSEGTVEPNVAPSRLFRLGENVRHVRCELPRPCASLKARS